MILKSGPLTQAELQAIWESSVDRGYREPLEAAGEGAGFEAWTQLFAQLERASQAVDVTTQALYISAWSGQSNPPAGGLHNATVTLTFARALQFSTPLVLGNGMIFVEEQQTDYGTDAGVTVATGRRYLLSSDLVFQPGEQGPFTVVATAEKPGYGYNNPRVGTLNLVDQPGTQFTNVGGTVTVTAQPAALNGPASTAFLIASNLPDMFIPEHVGQYVAFTAGSNAGKIARIVGFVPPNPPGFGSGAQLEIFYSLTLSSVSGTFQAGEALQLGASTGFGRVVGFEASTGRVGMVLVNGAAPVVGTTLLGRVSGATATVQVVLSATSPVAESGTAAWRILDWVADWGLTSTNLAQPSGGNSGLLDAIGSERNIGRAPGEDDGSYRDRVRQIADVVTPNAIRRALNRALSGLPWCLREVGTSNLPGWFYDGDLSPPGGSSNTSLISANDEASYDEDVFVLTGTSSQGASFDAGISAYDSGPFPSFFDGSGRFLGVPGSNDAVVLEDSSQDIAATGWFGSMKTPSGSPTSTMVFVRTSGMLPASLAGFRVRSLRTGALFPVTSGIVPNTVPQRRFRRYLDLTQFRGYFLVGVPRLSLQEFGYAYDKGATDGFDVQPFSAFYDGAPIGNAAVYLRTYYAVDAARAGGVGFDLYIEDIGCP